MSVKLPEPAKARVGVIGLGYVGLPLAVALARGVETDRFRHRQGARGRACAWP